MQEKAGQRVIVFGTVLGNLKDAWRRADARKTRDRLLPLFRAEV